MGEGEGVGEGERVGEGCEGVGLLYPPSMWSAFITWNSHFQELITKSKLGIDAGKH